VKLTFSRSQTLTSDVSERTVVTLNLPLRGCCLNVLSIGGPMVAPVTPGPTSSTTVFASFNGTNVAILDKRVDVTSRQHKPYNLWLPKAMTCIQLVDFKSTRVTDYPLMGNYEPLNVPSNEAAYAKAMSKLKDDINESSMWAVNIKEYKEAFALITHDAATILRGAKQISRFDFFGAAKTFKTYVPKGLKKKAKSFGDNFLKFHFGIEPLMADISSAVNVLQKAVPNRVVVGRGSAKSFWDTSHYYDPFTADIKQHWVDSKCRVQVEIRCNNPNLYLANQLGFVNPASFVWEVIPFSFVVDWFANVGQFLDQFSMFAGLDIVQSSNTYLQVNKQKTGGYQHRTNFPWVFLEFEYTIQSVWNKRANGLPLIALEVFPWKAPSPVRAATAISLLVQHLRS